MAEFEVSLYNRILFTKTVEAEDEEDAYSKLWEDGPDSLDLPEGFSISDPSAWEVDW